MEQPAYTTFFSFLFFLKICVAEQNNVAKTQQTKKSQASHLNMTNLTLN